MNKRALLNFGEVQLMQWKYKPNTGVTQCPGRKHKMWTNLTSKLQCAAGLPATHPPYCTSPPTAAHIESPSNKQARAKGKKEKHTQKNTTLRYAHENTELCESDSIKLSEILTQPNLSKSQFMCQIECKASLAKLAFPPLSKSRVGLCLLFFISIESPVGMV